MSSDEINYVVSQSNKFRTLLEFGSGRSTLLWAKNYENVISVECRLNWYWDVRNWLARKNLKNVRMIFSPAESCAFSRDGIELWNNRTPSDYGSKQEFIQYLRVAEEEIEALSEPSIIFIDANMRSEILDIALRNKIKHQVLIHDVTPDREYLNLWVHSKAYKITLSVDSLRVVSGNV
jgi:hypothetical protein